MPAPTDKVALREKRERDWHRSELLRLRAWARSAKPPKYKPSKILAVPPDMSFIAKPPVLLNSHIWRSLGIYEHRFLEALEVEHCRHAGKENGYLGPYLRSGIAARHQAQSLFDYCSAPRRIKAG